MKSSVAWNAVFWPYFMFIKVRNYLVPNLTTEDFRAKVRGPPANYAYGCHMTPITRGALRYVSYQKGIFQGHLFHRYASRRATALCYRIEFRTVLSLDVSAQTVFLYYMSMKYIWGVISDVLWCPCYTQVVMSNRWNQTFCQTCIGYIYEGTGEF